MYILKLIVMLCSKRYLSHIFLNSSKSVDKSLIVASIKGFIINLYDYSAEASVTDPGPYPLSQRGSIDRLRTTTQTELHLHTYIVYVGTVPFHFEYNTYVYMLRSTILLFTLLFCI